jgi:hypothetical protein
LRWGLSCIAHFLVPRETKVDARDTLHILLVKCKLKYASVGRCPESGKTDGGRAAH